jgi:ribosomal-protein-alanine N-acetyltransferase
LQLRGFEVREQIMSMERAGEHPPAKQPSGAAHIRTAHLNDLPLLTALDELAFEQNWHKRSRHFKEALAKAASFSVATVGNRIVAFEWTELYQQHAHITRLAVHPDYQGQGIGRQLIYQAIVDALSAGADLITLNTQETNQRSRALYKRFGFVDTGLRMPVLWKSLTSP